MSIPIIGQQQRGITVNVGLSVVPPVLTVSEGIHVIPVTLNRELATKLYVGFGEILKSFGEPENGIATPTAIPFRREGG